MADYTTIIAAIDTAITNWAGKPIQITAEDGRSTTYRKLPDLIAARKYYTNLQVKDNVASGRGFTITHLKSGGSRS